MEVGLATMLATFHHFIMKYHSLTKEHPWAMLLTWSPNRWWALFDTLVYEIASSLLIGVQKALQTIATDKVWSSEATCAVLQRLL